MADQLNMNGLSLGGNSYRPPHMRGKIGGDSMAGPGQGPAPGAPGINGSAWARYATTLTFYKPFTRLLTFSLVTTVATLLEHLLKTGDQTLRRRRSPLDKVDLVDLADLPRDRAAGTSNKSHLLIHKHMVPQAATVVVVVGEEQLAAVVMEDGLMESTLLDQSTHAWSGSCLVFQMTQPSNKRVLTSRSMMIFPLKLPATMFQNQSSSSPTLLSTTI
jgi:hypothetical protein